MKFSTKAIRVGQAPDPATGAIVTPIYQAVNYVFDEVGKPHNFEYSRSGNPTRTAFEQCLAALEEARYGVAFSSGMAAVDGVLSILRPGDHVVSAAHIYGGTYRLFEQVYKPRGISFTYVDGTNAPEFEKALTPATKLFWIETPANPLLQLVDVRAVTAIARKAGVKVVADNTFASPYVQRPLTQGVDIVLHSTTKYISGHSDVIGGAVVTSDEDAYQQIKFYNNAVGNVPGPMDVWLSLRGLKTLSVRMRQHQANAQAIAEFLAGHPKVQEVFYPGLASHPQHELARRQMDGFGAIVSFRIAGGVAAVGRLVKALRLFLFAESLGGVESLVCHPSTMSHGVLSESERLQAGICQGTLRLSVGIEDVQDLIADLEQALRAL